MNQSGFEFQQWTGEEWTAYGEWGWSVDARGGTNLRLQFRLCVKREGVHFEVLTIMVDDPLGQGFEIVTSDESERYFPEIDVLDLPCVREALPELREEALAMYRSPLWRRITELDVQMSRLKK